MRRSPALHVIPGIFDSTRLGRFRPARASALAVPPTSTPRRGDADRVRVTRLACCENQRLLNTVVIWEGTNLIVADNGFRGVYSSWRTTTFRREGLWRLGWRAGRRCRRSSISRCDRGLAGTRDDDGHSRVRGCGDLWKCGRVWAFHRGIDRSVRFFDGEGIRVFDNAQCEFRYRESVFKGHKQWIVFAAQLGMQPGDALVLRETADRFCRSEPEVSADDEVRG